MHQHMQCRSYYVREVTWCSVPHFRVPRATAPPGTQMKKKKKKAKKFADIAMYTA